MKERQSSREYIQALIESTNGLISINDAQEAFNIPRDKTSRLLYRLAKKGWIKKLTNGLYRVVPLEASDPSLTDESPWLISNELFTPCYIGCWTAANHWGLTEQLFLDTWIVTSQKVFVKKRVIADHNFILRQVPKSHFFGLTYEWIEKNKIAISDPHKTVLDFLCFPEAFSSKSMLDIVASYLGSREKDISILTGYTKDTKNKAVLKRLGFFLEYLGADARDLIDYCLNNKSKGISPLSTKTPCNKIISRWSLIIPSQLIEEI
jgi:predicted transcriptional regulator of viral defense system